MNHIYLSEYAACPLNASGRHVAAVKVGRIADRPYYRVPVMVRENSSRACATVATYWLTVYAHSAADAANYVSESLNRPETEVIAIGPKGGEVLRYTGWHSAIGRELFHETTGYNALRFPTYRTQPDMLT